MMEGYKESVVGIIPFEWMVSSLEDVCIPKQGMRRGPFGGAIKKEFFVADGFQVYEQRNAIYDNFNTCRYFINKSKYEELKAFHVKANDFIVSCSGTIGRIAKVPFDFKKGVINQALLRIRLNNLIINDDFFLQLFRFEPFQNKIIDGTQGGAMKNLVGMSVFRKTHVMLPPLPEQQKIAEILSTVDNKIELIDQQIKQTQELKKGLMQQLLTKGIGHTEFKDSPLGEIPLEWEVVKLGDLGEFSKGKGLAKKDLSVSGIPCVRYGELYTVHHNIIKEFKSYINSSKRGEGVRLVKGDILFAGSGETIEDIGKSAAFVSDIEAYVGGDVIIYKTKEFDSYFLGFVLNQEIINKQRRKFGQGNAVVHIYSKHLALLTLSKPSLQEQQQIAKILSTVDEKLDIQQSKKAEYTELKKGLMQQLLTGNIRVKI